MIIKKQTLPNSGSRAKQLPEERHKNLAQKLQQNILRRKEAKKNKPSS